MTHVSFEEYEAAKAEIIGGVHYKEKSTLEGNVIRKTYATEENGTFYEVNDGGRIEFWSDKHPDSRIYDENERADLPENVGAVPGYGDLLAEKIRETADFANLKPFEKFVLDNGYLYDSSDALKAGYASGGVLDIGADTMITKCSGVSTDFSKIVPGEAVWLSGHIGVYIGGGKVIECSPAFKNCVQVTACLNIGAISGMNGRRWTKHGKLPYITYDTAGAATGGAGTAQKPGGTSDASGALAFAVGDVVRFTGNQHFTNANAASGKACKQGKAKVTAISKGAKHPYHLIKESGGGSTVYGWVNAADVQSEADAAIDKLAGLGVINSPDYWKNAVAAGTVQYLDLLFIGAAEYIKKAGTRCATPEAGVDALAKAGVINSPDYWLQNYGKLQSLGTLLCALGGSV